MVCLTFALPMWLIGGKSILRRRPWPNYISVLAWMKGLQRLPDVALFLIFRRVRMGSCICLVVTFAMTGCVRLVLRGIPDNVPLSLCRYSLSIKRVILARSIFS